MKGRKEKGKERKRKRSISLVAIYLSKGTTSESKLSSETNLTVNNSNW